MGNSRDSSIGHFYKLAARKLKILCNTNVVRSVGAIMVTRVVQKKIECGKGIMILFKNPSNFKDHESHKTIEQTVKSQNCQIVKTAKRKKKASRSCRSSQSNDSRERYSINNIAMSKRPV